MTARHITIKDKNWYKEDRQPAGARDQLVIVRPELAEALKGCPKVMTVKQVADFLAFSIDTVYRWIRENKLRARAVGGRLRIFREDLAAFLNLHNGAQRV